jgi:hypothetical protein
LPCKNELKALLMRRLMESFATDVAGISDGLRLSTGSEWIIIRPCAGAEALQIFYGGENCRENREALAASVLKKLNAWMREADHMSS